MQQRSDLTVVRAGWKFAPHRNERDPKRTKCREGCASDIKFGTAPKSREGCASTCWMFAKHCAHQGKLEKSKTMFYLDLSYCFDGVYKVPPVRRKMGPRYPKCCTCHEKWPPKAPLMSCSCHAKPRSRPQNVPKLPHLPRKDNIAIAQKSEHGALVKQRHPSCASIGNRHARGHLPRELGARCCDPGLLHLRTPQCGHTVWEKKRSALLLQPISAPCGSRDADSPAPDMRPVNSPQDSHSIAPWPNAIGLGYKPQSVGYKPRKATISRRFEGCNHLPLHSTQASASSAWHGLGTWWVSIPVNSTHPRQATSSLGRSLSTSKVLKRTNFRTAQPLGSFHKWGHPQIILILI